MSRYTFSTNGRGQQRSRPPPSCEDDMAFTVEDGSGVEDANAYIPIDYADEYFSDRAITTWTGSDAVKQAAIIKATDYIEKVYGTRFLGYKNDEDPVSYTHLRAHETPE